MGLDITAVQKAQFMTTNEDEGEEHGYCFAYLNPDFPDRADGLAQGYYSTSGEIFAFCAGSYTSYSDWRDWLARFAGYPCPEALWHGDVLAGPFYELINFSDCEGIIGPETSKKLANDFRAFKGKARSLVPDSRYLRLYTLFQEAFELAQHDGFVKFH